MRLSLKWAAALAAAALICAPPPALAEPVSATITIVGITVTWGAVYGAIAVTLLNIALSFAAQALFGKQQALAGPSSRGITQMVRSPVSPRRIVYGERQVSGTLVFGSSAQLQSQNKNKFLFLVITLASHECEEVGDVYFNDKLPDDRQFTKIDDAIEVTKHLGTADQAADAGLVDTFPGQWSSAHRLRGIAYVVTKLKWSGDPIIWPTGTPNIKAVVKGKKLYDPRDGATRWSNNPALMLYDYLTADYGLDCSDSEIDVDSVIAAANTCDEFVTLADQSVTFTADATSDLLTPADNKIGLATGDKVRVSSSGTLPSGISAGTDYYWIKTSATGPNTCTAKLATSYANALARVAINITSAGSGTHTVTRKAQVRYTADGVVELDEKPIEIVEDMLTAMAGTLVYTQGKYRMFAGAAGTPVAQINTGHLRDQVKVLARPAKRDLFNAVRGTYCEPSKFWQVTDFPPVENSTYEDEDGGERVVRDIELRFTCDAIRAQRIGKLHLEVGRQGITATLPLNLSGLQLAVWDVIEYTDPAMGWSDKEFRVLSWTLAEGGGVDIAVQEHAAAAYAWNSSDPTIIDPAPDTNLPDIWNPEPPGDPAVVEELYASQTGAGVKSRAVVTWGAASDEFAQFYSLEWKPHADSAWRVAPLTRDTTQNIDDLGAGSYDFRVRTQNRVGVYSDYSATTTAQLVGLSARPADPTGLQLTPLNGQAHLRWDRATDLDVLIGGYVEVRYSGLTDGSATWASSVRLGPLLAGQATEATVPLLTGTYFVKFIDSSGNTSENADEIITTLPELIQMNVVQTITESSAFSGTKSNTVKSGSALQIDDTSLLSGTYTSGTTVELGAVFPCRVFASLQASVFGSGDTIDNRTANIDTWDSFDGSVVAAVANVQLEIRITNDNTAGSPTWSAWMPLPMVGNFSFRGLQWRVSLSTTDPDYNVAITTLALTVDMPDRVYEASGTSSSGGNTTVSPSPAFKATPKVGFTIKGAATGDYVDVVSTSASSIVFSIRNSAAARVAKDYDLIAKGYGSAS